jgi:GH25 family lysozyme M1 (1,4-beta-N-acetylmuramidase)
MRSTMFADLSSYQPTFNPLRYRRGGYALVALKATEGADNVDPRHKQRARQAHEAGLKVWHYHYARPDLHPKGEGETTNLWRTVQPAWLPGDQLVLDLELWPSGGPAAMALYCTALDTRIREISGHDPIGYTNIAMIDEAPEGWGLRSGLWWVAWYSGKLRRLPGKRTLVAQQVGEMGVFPGIPAHCDENVLTRAGVRLLR